MTQSDRILIGVVVMTWLAYFFNYYSGGPEFGARYWFLMIVPGVALTARALLQGAADASVRTSVAGHPGEATSDALASQAGGVAGDVGRMEGAGRAPHVLTESSRHKQLLTEQRDGQLAGLDARWLMAAALLSLGALMVFVPWRSVDKYRSLRGMRPEVVVMNRERPFGTSLVLVKGPPFPDYASVAVMNPLDLRSEAAIFARRTSRENDQSVIQAYAGRPVYFLDGPAVAGGRYVLRAGPLPTAHALEFLARDETAR